MVHPAHCNPLKIRNRRSFRIIWKYTSPNFVSLHDFNMKNILRHIIYFTANNSNIIVNVQILKIVHQNTIFLYNVKYCFHTGVKVSGITLVRWATSRLFTNTTQKGSDRPLVSFAGRSRASTISRFIIRWGS